MRAPVHIFDWMPTLGKLAGHAPRTDLEWDGRDIWPLIQSRATRARPRTLYWRTKSYQAICYGDWKLIVKNQQKVVGLYNVLTDPDEENDAAQQHPERVEDLKRRLAEVSADDR